MTHRISRRARVLCAALGAGVLVPLTVAATPAAAATTPQVTCTSSKAGLAAKLQKDITTALASRRGTVAVGLHDRVTIQTVARAIHKDLVPTTAQRCTPTSAPKEAFPAVPAS